MAVGIIYNLDYMPITKFYLKICTMIFPYYHLTFVYHCIRQKGYCLKFYKYNFPEISESTNNFILPLLMEVQN